MPERKTKSGTAARDGRWKLWLLLFLILFTGLGLRLALAPEPGYEFDVSVNQKWARSAVELGLSVSYLEQLDGNMLPNYPPLSLMIFAGTGWLYKALLSPEFDITAPVFSIWIKLPAILADILTAIALWAVVRRRGEIRGLFAAGLYAFHPAVLYDSAVWGQNEALYVLPLVLGLAAFGAREMLIAGFFFGVSILTKFQAIAVFPLLFLACDRPRNVRYLAYGGLGAAALILYPFIPDGGVRSIVDVYRDSIGYYNTVSVGAYNFWWSILGDSAWSIGDHKTLLWGMTFQRLGLLLAIASAAWVVMSPRLLRSAGKRTIEDIFLAAGLLSLSFFLFNTQMHERYLFPFFALALPAALKDRATLAHYCVIGLCGFINLLGVLPWGAFDRHLFSLFETLDIAVATTMVIVWMLMAIRFNQRKV